MGNPDKKQIKEFVDKVKEGNFTEEQSKELLELVKDKPTEEQFMKGIELYSNFMKENQEAADAKHKAEQEAEELAKKEAEKEIDPLKDFGRFLHSNKEAGEYFSIAVLTGDVSATKEPSELEKRQFLADFEAWKKAGKPRPSMPKMPKGKVKIPTAAYRIKDRDTDKMYVYYDNGSVLGKKEEYFKKKTTDPQTNETIETDEIDDTRKPVMTFDLEFSEKKAKEIIEESHKLVPPGRDFALYFFHKGAKQTISEKNFVKPYDKVSEMLERKQSID